MAKGRINTPEFLSVTHLAAWLKGSQDGQQALKAARPYSFETLQELEQWLQNTTEGNDLLSRFDKRRKVLVVLYADGWVECYAQRDVDVLTVVKPFAATPEAGVIAERYLDETLPMQYAELHWPGLRRAADKCRKVTAAQLLAAWYDNKVLEALRHA